MKHLIIKELRELFSGWLSVVVVAAFGLLSVVFLWLVPDTSYLSYGYATTQLFFDIGYYLMLFVVPALAIGFFSSEYRYGTIEILGALPQSWERIVGAKFIAGVLVILLLLLCSMPVFYVVHEVAVDRYADTAQIIGSSVGFVLIGAVYVAIAVAMSTLFENSSIAFITSVIVGFVLYAGVAMLSQMPGLSTDLQYTIERLSLSSHADYLSRGVLSLASIVYLLSISLLFLIIATWRLRTKQL